MDVGHRFSPCFLELSLKSLHRIPEETHLDLPVLQILDDCCGQKESKGNISSPRSAEPMAYKQSRKKFGNSYSHDSQSRQTAEELEDYVRKNES